MVAYFINSKKKKEREKIKSCLWLTCTPFYVQSDDYTARTVFLWFIEISPCEWLSIVSENIKQCSNFFFLPNIKCCAQVQTFRKSSDQTFKVAVVVVPLRSVKEEDWSNLRKYYLQLLTVFCFFSQKNVRMFKPASFCAIFTMCVCVCVCVCVCARAHVEKSNNFCFFWKSEELVGLCA